MFKIGQKVVCIADYSSSYQEKWAILFGTEFPQQGQVYTVRGVNVRPYQDDVATGILLHEILNMKNPLHRWGGDVDEDDPSIMHDEIAWLSSDFRPLITVEQFTEVRETVDA